MWGTKKSAVPGSTTPLPPSSSGGPATGGAASGGTPAKEKSSSYECFQADGDVVTVAVFAPDATRRDIGDFSPTAAQAAAVAAAAESTGVEGGGGGRDRHRRGNSLGDRHEGEAALAEAPAQGQIIVTAGYAGEIRCYENVGIPRWL